MSNYELIQTVLLLITIGGWLGVFVWGMTEFSNYSHDKSDLLDILSCKQLAEFYSIEHDDDAQKVILSKCTTEKTD